VKNLDNGGQFIVTPFARYSEMDFLMHFLPGTPLEQNGQKSIGLQTSYIRPVNTRLSLQQGVDIELTDAYLKQSQAAGFSRFPAGQQYDYQVDAIVAAAYINAKQRLNDRTSFELGIRFEAIEYDYDNRMLAGSSDENGDPCSVAPCRYSRPADREDSFENLSINASLLHNLTQNLAASLRLSHSYRPPQATELYRLQNGQLEAELDTEQLDSIELGLRGKLSLGQQRLRYSLVAFYMEKDNVIFQDNQRQNLDNGGTDHQGLEYELQWQLNAQWELSANGTFARHRYSKNVSLFGADSSLDVHGNDIDTAPRRMSSVRINWQASTNTSAELEWLAMGKYYTDIDNQRSYAGHDLYNLRVRQQLTADISVGLRINNLSDIDYAERADYSGFVGDRYFVGEPRSYFADLSIRF
jgi:outer membrane receptor protein involved in Fe transport